MEHIELSDRDLAAVEAVLDELQARWSSAENPEFLDEVAVWAHELPRRVRLGLRRFARREDGEGLCSISGLRIDDERIGATPRHWHDRPERSPSLREELFLVLCASLLGEPFAWATQQAGYIVHDVMPMRQHHDAQLGFGSSVRLEWHNEDAFHPARADYLALLCLRNPDAVPTSVFSAAWLGLESAELEPLFEARFVIHPDLSHLPASAGGASEYGSSEGYEVMAILDEAPEPLAVLSGDPALPDLRLDESFMRGLDPEAEAALARLSAHVSDGLRPIALAPGELLLVDNHRVVHGRPPYRPRYDGRDRWLKRLNVTRDLRRSRGYRSINSRVIG